MKRHTEKLAGAALNRVEWKDHGDVVNRHRCVAQVIEQLLHAREVTHGKCDEDHIDAVHLHVLDDVLQPTLDLEWGVPLTRSSEPVRGAIVEETGHLQGSRRRSLNTLSERNA